jgi:hypothetical protein
MGFEERVSGLAGCVEVSIDAGALKAAAAPSGKLVLLWHAGRIGGTAAGL